MAIKKSKEYVDVAAKKRKRHGTGKSVVPETTTNSQKGELITNTPVETGGRGGADPTRYGDWEINGRCVDF
ncbi:MAG: DUF1674 domain-containing protein [Pseudomonadota bacterium]|nr:DUF1674 domain-containing protein [Pseudomonadota bacterium]